MTESDYFIDDADRERDALIKEGRNQSSKALDQAYKLYSKDKPYCKTAAMWIIAITGLALLSAVQIKSMRDTYSFQKQIRAIPHDSRYPLSDRELFKLTNNYSLLTNNLWNAAAPCER